MACDWNLGIIYPIYKKSDYTHIHRHRDIDIDIDTYRETYTRREREREVGLLRQLKLSKILQKMAEYRHDTYHLFIGFKAANDSIARVKLYDARSSFGIPAKLIRLVRMTMTNVTCQVRVDGKLSGPFATT